MAATLQVPTMYPTIQAAVDAASFADTIAVAPGTYSSYSARVVDGVILRAGVHLKDGIALIGEGGSAVTAIDMMGVGEVHHALIGFGLASESSVVQGFTITGTIPGRIAVRISQCGAVMFRDCVWFDTDGDATSSGSFTGVWTDVVFESCVFRDCSNEGGIAAGPVVFDGSVTSRDCVFQDLVGCGIVGAVQYGPSWFILENCEFLRCKRDDSTGGSGGAQASGFQGGVRVSNCKFVECEARAGGGGIKISDGSATALVKSCAFIRCKSTLAGASGGAISAGQNIEVRGCTFSECDAGSTIGGSALRVQSPFVLSFLNNVVASCPPPGAAIRGADGLSTGDCNVFWDNAGGNAIGYVLGPNDREVDPQFCDAPNDDFTVNATSPCLPPNSLGCGFIGAFPQGCGTVSLDSESWGRIKERYR